MPFEDLTGNSGFTSDSDGASANLDITMSDESARNLWDVQAAIQQIATDFQTAVRAASDFNSYLISIREIGQTIKMPSLGMEGGEGGNMAYSGGRVDTGSVPIVQSELSQASRIGEMEENQSGAGGGAMASRNPNARPVDVGGFISQMATAGWLASSTGQQHNGHQVTNDAYQQAYQYAQNNPLDPQVLAATYNGQSGTPHAFAATQIVSQGLPAAQQFLRGGGLGGVAGMFGRIGTFGAVGYAGYQLVNAGLETYAQSRSLGIATLNSEHGTGWGFKQRFGQAVMAISPFVSQEEAAAIYSTAVDQGWASRRGGFEQGTFGQAVNFMYGAAKDYNMSPEMSAQLLQTNALGAGESVQALSQQLLTLKQSLDGTGVSMDAAASAFTSFTGFLIAAGANGPGAAQVAGGALNAYAGNTYLGRNGRGAEIVQQTLASQQTQNILAGLTGTLPGAALAGGHLQSSTAELDRLTKRLADQVMSMSNLDDDEKAAMFMQLYNSTFGTNISEADARNIMLEYVSNPNLLSEGQREYISKQGIEYRSGDDGRNAWDRYIGRIKDKTSGSWYNKITSSSSLITSIPSLWKETGGTMSSNRNYSPEVDNLLSNSANPDQVAVIDENGNVVAQGKDAVSTWFADEGNYKKFSASGSKYTIKDGGATWNAKNIGGAGPTGEIGVNTPNTVYITLSPEAKRYFSTNTDKLQISTGKN